MTRSSYKYITAIIAILAFSLIFTSISHAGTISVTNAAGQKKDVPEDPSSIICSGPGCLRLVSYLQAEDRVVAVDDMETQRRMFAARPYALANLQFRKYPIFGEFRGNDNPELIVTLETPPELIFKTYPESGYNPEELEQKTGIPVLTLDYGDLAGRRETLYSTLRIMGRVLKREERAEEVIAFFEKCIEDIEKRTAKNIQNSPSCFVGGIAHKGPHGIQSTEPAYPPFIFSNARNVFSVEGVTEASPVQTTISREKLVIWDPDVLFVDLSTIQSGPETNALHELANSPVYRELKAVKTGEVYGVVPYNWYTQNFGSILADAYFVGKVLYPEHFKDINPDKKADEIYEFLVGRKVLHQLQDAFENLIFKKIDISLYKSR